MLAKTISVRKNIYNLNQIGNVYKDIHRNTIIEVFPEYSINYHNTGVFLIKALKSETPSFVAISGARNSTKTTTTSKINNQLLSFNINSTSVSMDSYIFSNDIIHKMGINPVHQPKDPYAIDFKRAYENMRAIKNGKEFNLTARDRFKKDYKGNTFSYDAKKIDVMLSEGLSNCLPQSSVSGTFYHNSYIPRLSQMFPIKIFLKISRETAEKNLFNDYNRQNKLGIKTPERNIIYNRFLTSDIPRFDNHYKETESNSNIVFQMGYANNQYFLYKIIIEEEIGMRLENSGYIHEYVE